MLTQGPFESSSPSLRPAPSPFPPLLLSSHCPFLPPIRTFSLYPPLLLLAPPAYSPLLLSFAYLLRPFLSFTLSLLPPPIPPLASSLLHLPSPSLTPPPRPPVTSLHRPREGLWERGLRGSGDAPCLCDVTPGRIKDAVGGGGLLSTPWPSVVLALTGVGAAARFPPRRPRTRPLARIIFWSSVGRAAARPEGFRQEAWRSAATPDTRQSRRRRRDPVSWRRPNPTVTLGTWPESKSCSGITPMPREDE